MIVEEISLCFFAHGSSTFSGDIVFSHILKMKQKQFIGMTELPEQHNSWPKPEHDPNSYLNLKIMS